MPEINDKPMIEEVPASIDQLVEAMAKQQAAFDQRLTAAEKKASNARAIAIGVPIGMLVGNLAYYGGKAAYSYIKERYYSDSQVAVAV